MKFYSEQLNKLFDSAEELKAAEDKVNAEKKAEEEKKAALKAQREERAKEVEKALLKAAKDREQANKSQAAAINALNAFCKDFGAYHTSLRGKTSSNGFDELFTLFFENLF